MNASNDTAAQQLANTWPTWAQAVMWLFIVLVSLETVLGNLLVLLAYRVERSLRHPSNYLIASLAVSDLIIGLEGFPVLTLYLVAGERWEFGAILCRLWLSLDYTLCLVSIFSVLLITADRYISVCYPALHCAWVTPRNARIAVLASWIVSSILFLAIIFAWDTWGDSQGLTTTQGNCYAPFLTLPYLNMSLYVIYYWSSLAVMICLYKYILRAAKRLQKRERSKQRQAFAMAALQRCMAQMGVSIIIAANATRTTSSEPDAPNNAAQDSGYISAGQQQQQQQQQQNVGHRAIEPQLSSISSVSGFANRNNNHSDSMATCHARQGSFTSMDTYATVRTHYTGYSDFSMKTACYIALPEPDLESSEIESILFGSVASGKSTPVSDSGIEDIDHTASTKTIIATTAPSPPPTEALLSPATAHPSLSSSASAARQTLQPSSSNYSMMSDTDRKTSSSTCHGGDGHHSRSVQEIMRRIAAAPTLPPPSRKEPITAWTSQLRDMLQSNLLPALRRRKTKTQDEHQRARRAVQIISLILGSFALFWSPYFILATVFGFCQDCVPSSLFFISYYMCYLNSSVNPFCYALANRQFRKSFLRILQGDFRVRRTSRSWY